MDCSLDELFVQVPELAGGLSGGAWQTVRRQSLCEADGFREQFTQSHFRAFQVLFVQWTVCRYKKGLGALGDRLKSWEADCPSYGGGLSAAAVTVVSEMFSSRCAQCGLSAP